VLTITDPTELKPAEAYHQACMVAAKTSRGSDRSWYRDAFEMPCQWHLWFDGGREVVSATFSLKDHGWRQGPSVALASLTTGDGVGDLLAQLLSASFFGYRPRALGVILHIADEFALAGLKQATEGGAESQEELEILRYNLIDDPCEVLADHEVSVDTTSWRLLPYWGSAPGQPHGAAVALSRSREALLHQLLAHGEEMRLPIRVAVTSAAVECLAALPLIDPSAKGGRLVVMPYLKFTAVFALSPTGELISARSLVHRGGGLVPVGLGDILASIAVGAELAGAGSVGPTAPKVLLASGNPAALQAVAQELKNHSATRQPIEWQTINFSTHPALTGLPGRRPEFLVYDPARLEQARSGSTTLASTQTFAALWKTWLPKSNFFDTAKLDTLYPLLRDLRLLRFARMFSSLLVIAFISLGGYGVYTYYQASIHPSWSLTPQEIKATEDTQARLQVERHQIDVTHRLMLARSSGYLTLEWLLQLFPEDAGVRLVSFNYGMDADRPGLSTVQGKPANATGLVRTWAFRGLAKPQAQELLSNLNSQRGLSAFFDRVAKALKNNASYQPDPSRQMTVTLTQARNPRFTTAPPSPEVADDPTTAFPFTFEATITQALTDKDPLALPTEKPF
jgi:hypothetical protein